MRQKVVEVTSLVKKYGDLSAVRARNAIAFPMMFLSGAYWPVELMPD